MATYIHHIDGVDVEYTEAEHIAFMDEQPVTEHQVRQERDRLIAETDWWATADRTMTAEQTAYRQALRDVPAQSGFPANVTWPTKPSGA